MGYLDHLIIFHYNFASSYKFFSSNYIEPIYIYFKSCLRCLRKFCFFTFFYLLPSSAVSRLPHFIVQFICLKKYLPSFPISKRWIHKPILIQYQCYILKHDQLIHCSTNYILYIFQDIQRKFQQKKHISL